ncbi:MAG: hypothetical protein ABIK18_04835, partial [candidate division WOR-3 bacterium]
MIYLILVLFSASLSALILLIFEKREGDKRLLHIEAELARLEPLAFAKHYARLNQFQRRVGIVYLNRLPTTQDRTLANLFESGLRFAEHNAWDKALNRWQEAKSKAKRDELLALHILCAGCFIITRRQNEAQAELTRAIALAKKTKNKT